MGYVMIASMTGYAQVRRVVEGVTYIIEIRSLNNKYFKVAFKLPEIIAPFEVKLSQLIQEKLVRGSIYYSLKLRDGGKLFAPHINTEVIQKYLQTLQLILLEHPSENVRINLSELINLPGVCDLPEQDEEELIRQWGIIKELTEEAIEELWKMRREEGKSIWEDIKTQCESILRVHQEIKERGGVVIEEYADRLKERANQLLAKAELEISQENLIKEIALFAERSDINEELSRLKAHIEHFLCLARDVTYPGRQLEFLAQEMLREVNTIGSKANDATIAQLVVEAKGYVDRIREQTMNLV